MVWQCGGRGVSVHSTMPHWHLTAKVQHSHTHATPLWCLFSPMHPPVLLGRSYMCCKIRFGSKIMTRGPRVHSILMHDTWLKECVYVQWATQEHCTLLCMSLLEVKGTSGQLSYFHWSSFDKTPAEGNGGALYTFVNSKRGGDNGERTANWGRKREHSLIISLTVCIIYIEPIYCPGSYIYNDLEWSHWATHDVENML